MTDSNDVNFLLALQAQLKQRKNMSGETSYAASLFEKGDNAILKKVAEEAGEVIMATKDGDNHEIIYEVADLLFHCMVLLEAKDISIEQVVNELARRSGVSGLEEKASRQK